jgi:tetratricopeptide (TPR) repeat protein
MVGMAPAAVANPSDAKAEAAGKVNAANSAKPAEAAKPVPAAQAPIAPGTQRAYDDARRLLAAGRIDEAERAFLALTKSAPDLAGAHANLGLIYRQAGKLAEAVTQLEKAAALSPQQPVVFNQLGVTYRQQGQFEKAKDAYEKAIDLDPQYAAAVLNLGILNDLYLRDNTRALALYDRYQAMTGGKDATVAKWVADLKNRKPAGKKEPS